MTHTYSRLESLPAEIGDRILRSVPDTKTLFSCVAASPYLLRLYSRSRDQIFISVVKNEIDRRLIQHAIFLLQEPDPPHVLEDFICDIDDLSTVKAKILLQQDKLARSIIQICINDELEAETDVPLTEIEWLRLRRGLYNLRVAAKLSNPYYPGEFTDIRPFCEQCTVTEILEILFVLNCLRNRYARNLHALDDTLVKEAISQPSRLSFLAGRHEFFSIESEDERILYNANSSFTSDIYTLQANCHSAGHWDDDKWAWGPMRHFVGGVWEPLNILHSAMPIDYIFDNNGDGFRWLNNAKTAGYGGHYRYAIPLGFMIWDNKRLEQMEWMRKPPPLEPIEEKWRTSYQGYQSVERKLRAADVAAWERRFDRFSWHRSKAYK